MSQHLPLSRYSTVTLVILSALMFCLSYSSSWKDSPTHDEPEHVAAGYAYLKYSKYRYNIYHPPLVKDLAALPLQFIDLNFPLGSKAWERGYYKKVGKEFFFELGNDAYLLTRLSRLPVVLFISLAFLFVALWIKRRFNANAAFIFLALSVLQPTILGHASYVTTDVPAALGLLLGMIAIVTLFESTSFKLLLASAFLFVIAQLTKYSVLILFPLSYLLAFVYWWLVRKASAEQARRILRRLITRLFTFQLLSIVLIAIVYAVHTLNFSADYQLRYMQSVSQALPEFLRAPYLLGGEYTLLRPLFWFLTGVISLLLHTVGGGNLTSYLGGSTYQGGDPLFFPSLFAFKEPLDTFVFVSLAIFASLIYLRPKGFRFDLRQQLALSAALLIFIFYWLVALFVGLNIGIRHIIPTLPLLYFLIAVCISGLLSFLGERDARKAKLLLTVICLLLSFRLLTTLSSWPHFLSYYNPLFAGAEGGHQLSVVSDYDWGQDLIRLNDLLEEKKIQKVHLAYSNTADPSYYLGDRFVHWWPSNSKPQAGEYFALSVTLLYIPRYAGVSSASELEWLRKMKPIARAGKSIFVYQMPVLETVND